ncbi:MAG TPA: ABC transporter substrate-binding protein [Stellaceae bacterium]|nr:ABC transporter substrate-binding protein [Stellaceae bacterium]
MKLTPLFALAFSSALFLHGPALAAEPFEIPAIVSLTGQGAFLGGQVHDALQLLEKTVNGTGGIHGAPVHMDFHDDQSNPQISVQLMNEVVAAHAPIVLGSTLVADCNAMSPLTKQGPVQYCFSPGIHPPAGSYVFTSSTSTLDLEKALVRYFRLKGWTRLALATSTDATGQDADRGFSEVLADPENKAVTLAAHVHFNVTDVSVSAQMEQIRAAGPQAVIVWSTGSPVGTLLRGLIQAGIDLPVGTTGGNMTYAQMKLLSQVLPKQFYFPSAEWPIGDDPRVKLDPAVIAKQKQYYAAFAEAGLRPDEGSVLGWDPGTIVIDALRALPAGATATQVRDHILQQKKQPGVNGMYDFVAVPQRGLSLDDVVITAWDADKGGWRLVSEPAGAPLAP